MDTVFFEVYSLPDSVNVRKFGRMLLLEWGHVVGEYMATEV